MNLKDKAVIFIISVCLNVPLLGQNQLDHQQIEGEIIVRLQHESDVNTFLSDFNQNRAFGQTLRLKKSLGSKHNIHLLRFNPQTTDFNLLLQSANNHPAVTATQGNFTLSPRLDPDDAYFSDQWDMEIIQAPKVWDVTTGGLTALGDTIVVAIIDSGFNEQHEDLAPNLWRNFAEIPGDGVDNDGNDFVDDIHGWSFNNNSGDFIYDSHGTSVTGIVGAKGNNQVGVTGVNWDVQLMLFDIANVGDAIEAYEYVIDMREKYNASNGEEGAFIVATNASFGQRQRFCDDQPVWGGMYDLMGEVGILTGAGPANSAWDVEEVGDMPTTCPSDYLITVLNTTMEDKKYQGSAYGRVSIDMGSPGHNSFTVNGFDQYDTFGGNSAAAPHLTGAIALLYSIPCDDLAAEALTNPAQTALRIREALINGVDSISALSNFTATGGRLNIFNSMEELQGFCGSTVGDLDIISLAPNPTRYSLIVKYESPDFEPLPIRVFNVLGQLVIQRAEEVPRFGAKRFELNTSNLASGTYFLQIGTESNYRIEKFIKQ